MGSTFRRDTRRNPSSLAIWGIYAQGRRKLRSGAVAAAVLMGIASHDVMTANLIYAKAKAKGMGKMVEIQIPRNKDLLTKPKGEGWYP